MNKPCNKCEKSFEFKGKHFPSQECHNCDKISKYNAYLENKRKYTIGEKIKNLNELLDQTWIYWIHCQNKPLHITVIRNWQFNIVLENLEKGNFYTAIRKEK